MLNPNGRLNIRSNPHLREGVLALARHVQHVCCPVKVVKFVNVVKVANVVKVSILAAI